MIKIIVSFILGFMVATVIFAAQEYGYFSAPVKISLSELKNKMQCTYYDSQAIWYAKSNNNLYYLISLKYPLKKTEYLVRKDQVKFQINGNKEIHIIKLKGGQILLNK